MHPHLYELDQVNAGIQQDHRDALQDEQLRGARGTQPDRLALLTMQLRATVTSLGMCLRHRPVVALDQADTVVSA